MGMLEIYNETVSDLLVPDYTNLQIREDSAQGTYVENLSSHRVNAGVPPLPRLSSETWKLLACRKLRAPFSVPLSSGLCVRWSNSRCSEHHSTGK